MRVCMRLGSLLVTKALVSNPPKIPIIQQQPTNQPTNQTRNAKVRSSVTAYKKYSLRCTLCGGARFPSSESTQSATSMKCPPKEGLVEGCGERGEGGGGGGEGGGGSYLQRIF